MRLSSCLFPLLWCLAAAYLLPSVNADRGSPRQLVKATVEPFSAMNDAELLSTMVTAYDAVAVQTDSGRVLSGDLRQ